MPTPPLIKLTSTQIPTSLREIPQPPSTLYYQGTPLMERENFLTIVGSRKCSSYGRDVCESLIAGLRGFPITIVSGLALGIDTIVHRSALENNLKTIAFPGSGLDPAVLYPRSNLRLAQEIIDRGGALISESEPKEKATLYSFPKRNRLMAGISKATLIIEANQKSGTLITARLALDYNREVLAVPGAIDWPNSWGPNWLIKQGATPITESQDILAVFGLNSNHQQKLWSTDDLDETELKIVKLLGEKSYTKDDLISAIKIPIDEANTVLMLLELKGVVKEVAGEVYLC